MSLRDSEDLQREDLSELVVKDRSTVASLASHLDSSVLVKHLKTFRKFACMKADFYVLDKDLGFPLILKGDAGGKATVLTFEGDRIRSNFSSFCFLCFNFIIEKELFFLFFFL